MQNIKILPFNHAIQAIDSDDNNIPILIEQLQAIYNHAGWDRKHVLYQGDTLETLVAVDLKIRCAVGVLRLFHDQNYFAHIIDVIVDKCYRGMGVGSMLCDEAVRFCLEELDINKNKGELTVFANESASGFYKDQDWWPLPAERAFYWGFDHYPVRRKNESSRT